MYDRQPLQDARLLTRAFEWRLQCCPFPHMRSLLFTARFGLLISRGQADHGGLGAL